jgi:hypothetical protein
MTDQPSLAGLSSITHATRQFLPGYFHSRLSALEPHALTLDLVPDDFRCSGG